MTTTRIDIDRVLCPVDFSEFSSPALERAIRIAAWFEARVEVLHVIPSLPLPVFAGLGATYYPTPEVTAIEREGAAKSLVDLVAPFRGEGAPIVTKVLEGEPWRVILDETKGMAADLLVIGTHGRGGFERLLLGSVTEKVLRRAPCPVLTVGRVSAHSRKGRLFHRILCAADLTHASQQTLDVALSLAAENDARITLLHVMETLPGDQGPGLVVRAPEIGPLHQDLVIEVRGELRKAVPEAVRSFCEVTERVEAGSPWREILRVAEEVDADLIVMGAHATGAVGRMLFGSTTNHVVRRANCPVLILQESNEMRPKVEVAETEMAKVASTA